MEILLLLCVELLLILLRIMGRSRGQQVLMLVKVTIIMVEAHLVVVPGAAATMEQVVALQTEVVLKAATVVHHTIMAKVEVVKVVDLKAEVVLQEAIQVVEVEVPGEVEEALLLHGTIVQILSKKNQLFASKQVLSILKIRMTLQIHWLQVKNSSVIVTHLSQVH